MSADPVLVIEVGGTTIRAARYLTDRACLAEVRTTRTPAPWNGTGAAHSHLRSVIELAARSAAELMGGVHPAKVGVAYAGPLDASGRVLAAPTILRGRSDGPFDLAAVCRETWPSTEVLVLNDLTAAGIAHVTDETQDFVILTVGSGIGHKVFLGGRPRVGAGRGGEIGHLRLDFSADALPCDCGGRGHLGALASGRGTAAMVRRHGELAPAEYADSALGQTPCEQLSGEAVAAAYRAGDSFTRTAVAVSQNYLGQALAAIHLDVGVEDFIITGGFAGGMGHDYLAGVAAAASRSSWNLGEDWTRMVRPSVLGEQAALLGLGRALTQRRSSVRGS